ncbi:unnamed protein product [Rhizophagus irregularis]|nr:unnamed protein product [Rhizophagus irregularis]
MVSIHIAGSQFFLLSNFFFIIYSRQLFDISVPNVKEDLYSAEFLSLRSFLHFFQWPLEFCRSIPIIFKGDCPVLPTSSPRLVPSTSSLLPVP